MHSFYSAKDIPGKNSFIPLKQTIPIMLEDEEIFVGVDSKILYYGQPCGMILANSMDLAYYAASQVKITYKKVKGKESIVSGNLLDVIDNLKDSDDRNEEIEGNSQIIQFNVN